MSRPPHGGCRFSVGERETETEDELSRKLLLDGVMMVMGRALAGGGDDEHFSKLSFSAFQTVNTGEA